VAIVVVSLTASGKFARADRGRAFALDETIAIGPDAKTRKPNRPSRELNAMLRQSIDIAAHGSVMMMARLHMAASTRPTGQVTRADSNDSASMNIWLHKRVMTKLAANGGKLPPEIKR
jgi:hypothetical protein